MSSTNVTKEDNNALMCDNRERGIEGGREGKKYTKINSTLCEWRGMITIVVNRITLK